MLDPQQTIAADCGDTRILLKAGAGSGKTRTLEGRVSRLLRSHYHPREILVITFTRKAAKEARERIAEAHQQGKRVSVTTFHSWAASILREFHDLVPISRDFSIRDEQDQDDLLKLCAVELDETRKKAGADRDAWIERPLAAATRKRLLGNARIMERYRQLMREAQALDYDMLEATLYDLLSGRIAKQEDLHHVAEQLRIRYLHVLVDEYQDTSPVQQSILDRLAPSNLFLVGDASQSIYSFRGADVTGFICAGDRPGMTSLTLPANYRSVSPIVEAANRCAAAMAYPGIEMESRRDADYITHGVDTMSMEMENIAASIKDTHALETWGSLAWKDIAILSPTWGLLEDLAIDLEAANIPFSIARKRLDVWESPEMRWLLDCARVALNPWDHLALRQALLAFSPRVQPWEWAAMRAVALGTGEPVAAIIKSSPVEEAICAMRKGWDGLPIAATFLDLELVRLHLTSRTMGPALAALRVWRDANPEATLQDLLTWYSARRHTDPEVADEADAVTLTTIHGAKGLEWPVVYVLGCD